MGYKKARKRYRLTFEDPDLAGFEVVMGSLSIGEFMRMTGELSTVESDKNSKNATSVVLERFAKSIISWNLEEEDGTPVPANLAGVETQEFGFITQIIYAWMDSIASVDPTSRRNVNGTGNFPEASLPMETLSLSLPN